MKKIVLTGGGSSGHVTPNIALIPALKRAGYLIDYVGSHNGIEKQLIEKEGIPYHSISTGKLRRYFDPKNFTDAFRVLGGLRQAYSLLRKLKPDIVFSKGGFVSCPVVWAAWLRRIPAVIHESDMTPGLTNRLSIPFAKTVCYTFPESESHIPIKKGIKTGIPIRDELMSGDRFIGKRICGFTNDKPVIMVIGGSQGSEKINEMIRSILIYLLKDFNVCHICGKGNIQQELENKKGYKQFEYISEEQPHIFALADLVVSRAGATVLFELLALKKPNLLIPLSKAASRGDQILNAASFEKQGFSQVLHEESMNAETLLSAIVDLHSSKSRFSAAMTQNKNENSVNAIIRILEEAAKK